MPSTSHDLFLPVNADTWERLTVAGRPVDDYREISLMGEMLGGHELEEAPWRP
jgi:hypothetical protein